MGESSARHSRRSSENIRTIVLRNSLGDRISKFGKVVQVLWPEKPALNLAQRAGISERGAQYLIDGKRKPSARAVHAVTAELLD